jgi:hypothetical protein
MATLIVNVLVYVLLAVGTAWIFVTLGEAWRAC